MNYQLSLGFSSMGVPLTWEGTPNFHTYITGCSGMGKTYFLRNMAAQIPALGGRCIIFDYSGDFIAGTPQQDWPVAGTEIIDIRAGGIWINPFQPQSEDETNDEIAERVVDMICSGIRLGPTQWAYLSNAILDGLAQGSLRGFSDLINLIEGDEDNAEVANRLLPKVKKLARLLPHSGKPVDWQLDTPGITVIGLHRIKDATALAVLVEMLLGSICGIRMNGEPVQESAPLVLLLDECQRLRFTEGSYTNRILREGRKYGIWGWFSTQWISDPYRFCRPWASRSKNLLSPSRG